MKVLERKERRQKHVRKKEGKMKERENIEVKMERRKRGKKEDNSVCSGEYLFEK